MANITAGVHWIDRGRGVSRAVGSRWLAFGSSGPHFPDVEGIQLDAVFHLTHRLLALVKLPPVTAGAGLTVIVIPDHSTTVKIHFLLQKSQCSFFGVNFSLFFFLISPFENPEETECNLHGRYRRQWTQFVFPIHAS